MVLRGKEFISTFFSVTLAGRNACCSGPPIPVEHPKLLLKMPNARSTVKV